jgi:hypothetical protein
MNRNVEPICGKVQVKGKDGLRGMSVPDIEKLIMAEVKGTDKEGEFKRYKTSIPKGASKRLRYCAFIKDNIRGVWNEYNTRPAAAPKRVQVASSVPQVFRDMLSNFNNKRTNVSGNSGIPTIPRSRLAAANNSRVMNVGNEDVDMPSWANMNNDEREGGNYANKKNGNARMVFDPTTFARGSRVGNGDPFKKSKPSEYLRKLVETKLRRMKRRGETIPPLKTEEDMVKFAMLKKPTNFTKMPSISARAFGNKANLRSRVKRMGMPKGVSNAATRRVARGPSVVVPIGGTKLSVPEIRKATGRADILTNKVMKVGQDREFLREVLASNAPANANSIAIKLAGLAKFNRDSVRAVVRGFEIDRAKVLKNMGAPIAGVTAGNLPSGSSLIVPVSIAEIARNARKKKVAERTAVEKRALKAMDRLAKLKAARKRRTQPGTVKMTETTRPLNLFSNSNRNSNSNGNSNAGSMRSTKMRMRNSNSNSNSNSNNGPALAQPIVKIDGSKVMVNNANVNQMNKSKLQSAARRILSVVRPGTESGLWLNATNDELRRIVKGGAKKMISKSK